MAALKDLGDFEQLGKQCPGLATSGRLGSVSPGPYRELPILSLAKFCWSPSRGLEGTFPVLLWLE